MAISPDIEDNFARAMHAFLSGQLKPGGADCPHPGLLSAYREKKLSTEEAAYVEAHLAACDSCRVRLEALAKLEVVTPEGRWVPGGEPTMVIDAPESTLILPDPRSKPEPEQEATLVLPSFEPVPTYTLLDRELVNRPMRQRVFDEPKDAILFTQRRRGRGLPVLVIAAALLGVALAAWRFAPERADGLIAHWLGDSPVEILRSAETSSPREVSPPHVEPAAEERAPAPPAVVEQGLPLMQEPPPARAIASSPEMIEPIVEVPMAEEPQPAADRLAAIASAKERPPVPKPAPAARTLVEDLEDTDSPVLPAIVPDELVAAARSNPETRWRLSGASPEHSTDGGLTWRRQSGPSASDLIAASAPSTVVCWAAGKHGTVVRTIDGERWETVTAPTADDLVQVTAWNAGSATVKSVRGRRFSTVDGGATWSKR